MRLKSEPIYSPVLMESTPADIDPSHGKQPGKPNVPYRGLVCLLLCLCLVLHGPWLLAVQAEENQDAAAAEESTRSSLYALSAVLMDADNGRILLSKNGTEVLPMASTTKIMTCILALEQADPEDYVSVSSYAAGMPKVHLGATKGEVFQLKDLLYSLMLESHNDSAVIIAEHIGNNLAGGGRRSADNTAEESKEAVLRFTSLMNTKAGEIGCTDTFFVTPNGLDGMLTLTDRQGKSVEYQHSTTAADLARIMSYCITDSPKKEEFLEITRTSSYSFCDYTLGEGKVWQPGPRQFSCTNHNAFLGMMEGALTGKTGFTGKAGYCYVGALTRDGKTFSIALLACGWPNNKTWKWHDAKLLYEYGLTCYEKKNICQPAELPALPVTDGVGDRVTLELKPEEISLLVCESDEIRTATDLPSTLQAPVEAGKRIGWQNYYVNGDLYAQLPILTKDAIPLLTYRYCLEKLLNLFIL